MTPEPREPFVAREKPTLVCEALENSELELRIARFGSSHLK
jgi:hypothetical protein